MNIRELLKPKPADNRLQRIEAKLVAADPYLLAGYEDEAYFVTREEMLFLVEQKSRRIRVSSQATEKISEHLVSIECRAKRNRWRPTGYAICRLCIDRQMPPAIFEAGATREEEEGRAILRHLSQIHPDL